MNSTETLEAETAPGPGQSGSCHLLFVDDEPRILSAVQRALRGAGPGWRLSVAGSVDEALAIINAGGIDVIITDFNMPGRDGLDLIRTVAGSKTSQHIPVLMLTGNAETDLKRRALEAGAFDLVAKPVSREDLIARVTSVLRTKRYADELASLNATLERQVRERTGALEQSRTEILLCLAMAGECRDTDTGRHLVRVANYSRLVAMAMGLPAGEVDNIFRASPLHDIGKLGVPDHVLLKAGPLNDAERNLMKKHCEIGHRILTAHQSMQGALAATGGSHAAEGNPLLQTAATIALNHHEKWDGSGYPNGLSAGQIPLNARIVAIADVYDALTTVRPYKNAIPHDQAMEMIIHSSGSHFQPEIAGVFENHGQQIDDIRHQWIDHQARQFDLEHPSLRGVVPLLNVA